MWRALPPGRLPSNLPRGEWSLPLPTPQNPGNPAPAWLFFPIAPIGSEAAESKLLSQSLGSFLIRISNFNPRLGLLAENQELEPGFLARFQPNLASRMLGLSFLAFGPFLHILEFWLQITMKPKDFSWGNTSWEHFCNRLGAGSLSHWSLLRTIFGLKVAHRFSFDRVFLQGSTFLPPISEHGNFERCILGGWMRMGLQNWVISGLWCILGRWYRMGWLTCVV